MEQQPKNKGGRPLGSIDPKATFRNEEGRKEQERERNRKYRLTDSYLNHKIRKLCIKHNLNIEVSKDLNRDELLELQKNIKLRILSIKADGLREMMKF